MNRELLDFFRQAYAPGRIAIVGATDLVGRIVRMGQAGLTLDGKPSRWSHAFLLGEVRPDGRDDGSIYIFESDLHVSVKNWMVMNGAQENRLVKWCRDDIEHACVLGLNLTPEEQGAVVRKGLELAHDEQRLRYPVGALFGTLWAIVTRRLDQKNIYDDKYAAQCATFVRMCYQAIGRDILSGPTDLSHTSPEKIWQSQVFTFRSELHREMPKAAGEARPGP